MKKKVLNVKNITSGYNGDVILKDISFDLCENEIIAIMGPSGCGKSTLIKLLANLMSPDSGSIEFFDHMVQSIAVMFQTPLLQPWLSVEANIALPGRLHGNSVASSELLTAVRLAGFEKRYPFELSGGEQRRVALARALAQSPSILCLDEPFAGVDELTKERLLELIASILFNKKIPCIFVSHNPYESVFLADRLLLLEGKPASLIAEIKIELENPRKIELMETKQFHDYITLVREHMRGSIE